MAAWPADEGEEMMVSPCAALRPLVDAHQLDL
jgi:hypothetical protein